MKIKIEQMEKDKEKESQRTNEAERDTSKEVLQKVETMSEDTKKEKCLQ